MSRELSWWTKSAIERGPWCVYCGCVLKLKKKHKGWLAVPEGPFIYTPSPLEYECQDCGAKVYIARP